MFKALIEKITAVFAQPKAGVVAPVPEKVEVVMNKPIVEITPDVKVQQAQPKKKPAPKKAPAKKTAKKVTK